MAMQYHVFGPVLVKIGNTVLGQSDGQNLITIEEIVPHRPITTDSMGGEPADFVQQGAHAVVAITFIEWDDTELDKILAAMAEDSTVANPARADQGNMGAVGMLRIRDGGYVSVVVEGTKTTARDGGHRFTFPRAFRDPNSPTPLRNIGSDNSARALVLYCMPDENGDFYTKESIS